MSDIRDDINEAFPDDVEEPVQEVIQPAGEDEAGPEVEASEGQALEESVDEAEAPEPDSAPAEQEVAATDEPAPDAGGEDGGKPPLGWAADAREEWSKVPASVRSQIDKREREMEKAMAHTAEAKRSFSELSQLSQTYGSVMAAEGARTPMEAINGLMQTVSQLRLGSPQQKAQKMAQLVSHYGIDIGALDQALVGETPEASPNSEFEHMLDQRMAPVNEMMNNLAGMQQGGQQKIQENAKSEIDEFSKGKEFLNDVRNDMADMLDLAHKRGQEMSLEDAYNRACSFHPTVSEVIKSRAAASALKKQAASSSVVGSGAPATGGGDKSIADTLREAWGD